jgi:hypothetical protein
MTSPEDQQSEPNDEPIKSNEDSTLSVRGPTSCEAIVCTEADRVQQLLENDQKSTKLDD